MQQIIDAAAQHYFWTLLAGCFVFGSILKAVTSVLQTSARERSRREIAAYVAEGSMSPEQGERLIRADVDAQASKAA